MKAITYMLAACFAGCGASPAAGAPFPVHHTGEEAFVVLAPGDSAPQAMTLVGAHDSCEPSRRDRVRITGGAQTVRVEASCAPEVALDGHAPGARLVPLRFETMPSGQGRVGSAEGWTVRLSHGPAEEDCPGLPTHVQVKLGREPVLRENVWFHVREVHLLTTGTRAWLMLRGGGRAQAIALGHDASGRRFSLPNGGDEPCR